ncbi:hypothetical protein PXJ20_31770 [Paraburkholderia sp. A1RI_3L]|uniref:hypothetical protein n=1 Tax=Paraburkholderia TaxID=1822464 RepID=UPI003B7C02ED
MQHLKEDLRRLRREIVVSRKARQKLLKGLGEYRLDLHHEVANTLTRQHMQHAEMFALAQNARRTFVQDITRQVNATRSVWRAELTKARHAWLG